jgi:hypothetical protein
LSSTQQSLTQTPPAHVGDTIALKGEFILPAGESTGDCVAFALPPGVKPVKVKYTPPPGIAKDVGEWLNP